MRPEARHHNRVFLSLSFSPSLSFFLSRISLKTTRTFTCGSRKDWRWVFLYFFFLREGLWSCTRNSRHLLPSSTRSSAFPCSLAGSAKHTRAHTDSPFLGRLKPFPRFYILDEIPAALCPFITFANQMMSLDILRLGFIVVFYAGRTASVKRIRAERSRLIGYHAKIRSLSRSRSPDRRPYSLFLLLTATWEPAILFYCLYIAGYFVAAFHVRPRVLYTRIFLR